jgi:hypothetical protein
MIRDKVGGAIEMAAAARTGLAILAPTAPANFNAVTDVATGEFVKLVCRDDVLYPESLAMQLAALTAHPSAVLAASARDIDDAPVALRGSVHCFLPGSARNGSGRPSGAA